MDGRKYLLKWTIKRCGSQAKGILATEGYFLAFLMLFENRTRLIASSKPHRRVGLVFAHLGRTGIGFLSHGIILCSRSRILCRHIKSPICHDRPPEIFKGYRPIAVVNAFLDAYDIVRLPCRVLHVPFPFISRHHHVHSGGRGQLLALFTFWHER